ncbi:MAG: hypothetical protein ACKVGZ_07390 [Alphaproteobacteria bacterium]|jgi:hypothetical protein
MTGVLIVWTAIAADKEALFNGWYNRQHLSERTNVPGFRNGRRYRCVQGGPAYLAWYELDSAGVLESPAYAERQNNPTAWTQAVMPGFGDFTRVAGSVRVKVGQGIGSACASWRLTPVAGQEEAMAAWLTDEVMPRLMADTSVISAVLAAPADDVADAGPDSTESQMRETPDNPPCWGLLVETAGIEAADVVQAELSQNLLLQHGVANSEAGIYALLTALGEFDSQPAPDPVS